MTRGGATFAGRKRVQEERERVIFRNACFVSSNQLARDSFLGDANSPHGRTRCKHPRRAEASTQLTLPVTPTGKRLNGDATAFAPINAPIASTPSTPISKRTPQNRTRRGENVSHPYIRPRLLLRSGFPLILYRDD